MSTDCLQTETRDRTQPIRTPLGAPSLDIPSLVFSRDNRHSPGDIGCAGGTTVFRAWLNGATGTIAQARRAFRCNPAGSCGQRDCASRRVALLQRLDAHDEAL